mgnify:FL=1
MAKQITEKENYLMLLRGEQPYWVPNFTFGPMPGMPHPAATTGFPLQFLNANRKPGGGKDIWGVNYVGSDSTSGALIPEPNNFILTDIRKWRDVIKAIDLSEIDFEQQVKNGFDELYKIGVNREDTCIELGLHFGYFQTLVSFMGFENALCAMYEEPEEVKALLSYLCDFYTTIVEKTIDLIKPDIYALCDDVATKRSPFMSPEMYRELILPFHDREAKYARDRGLPIGMHCCGQCMDLIDDWVSIGVVTWNPAQTTNDLKAVKAKYGNKLVITGGFDTEGRLVEPDCTEEEVRQAVRDVIDALAPGGGYCFCGGFVAAVGDDVTARKNQIIMDEVYKYGSTFYGYDVSIRKGFPDGKGYTGGGFLTPGVVKEEPKEPVTV